MPRFFQPSNSPLAPERDLPTASALQQLDDDDLFLGWESANPALQFDSWEPAPSAQQGSAGSC